MTKEYQVLWMDVKSSAEEIEAEINRMFHEGYEFVSTIVLDGVSRFFIFRLIDHRYNHFKGK